MYSFNFSNTSDLCFIRYTQVYLECSLMNVTKYRLPLRGWVSNGPTTSECTQYSRRSARGNWDLNWWQWDFAIAHEVNMVLDLLFQLQKRCRAFECKWPRCWWMMSVETERQLVWDGCWTVHSSLVFGDLMACSSSPLVLFWYTMRSSVPEKVAPRSHNLVAEIKLMEILGQ